MKHINNKKHQKFSIALALVAALGFTSAYADNSGEALNQNTLIDWSHKAQAALSKKLDQKLNQQLMQAPVETRLVQVTVKPTYETANLVLAGKKLAHSNLSPLSSIPVVIIRNEKKDCLINL